jgi:hypothetical protein
VTALTDAEKNEKLEKRMLKSKMEEVDDTYLMIIAKRKHTDVALTHQ